MPIPRGTLLGMPSPRTGAQIIWECLVHEGVNTVFGYPGGAILPAYDAMLDYPVRHVLVRHEQGATHMADGYARAGGGVGVAIATSGPGATNMVTGIATAMMDSVPMVCITGQVPSKLIGYDAFQETDITGITLPITKHSYLVTRIEDIMPAMKEAFHLAKSGRPGPVLVDITKDAQQAKMEFAWDNSPVRMRGYRGAPGVAKSGLMKAVDLIKASRKPVILAGQGILQSGAMREVRAFAELINAPVAMTLLGLGGFPASHPLNIGMMGMHGEAWVNHAIQEADLLLAFGMRFDDRVTGNLKTYAVNAKKIHIDIDPSEINKNVVADAAICADLREALKDLLDVVGEHDHEPWLKYIGSMKGTAAVRDIQTLPDNGHLYAPHVINDIWRITDGNAIIATDVGQHQMWEAQYYKHESPRTLITSGGLGTMGFGLPAAIGAKMARPDAEVWAIVGDGGFQMTQAELTTAAQEGVKVNVAIINNGFLGMVRQWQEFFYDRRYAATPLRSPDFVKLAEAHGLLGLRVEKRGDVLEAVERARRDEGTVVMDFRVEQEDSVYPMVPAGADLHAMIRRPEKSALVETAADPI
ncbi:MAG TPA: biosynthetic-type acetolactate synthase large subunit [Vicinamibacterales bacterium]|jgi:acetolactate synthase-1/2/3 large subunit|nr:biosynthetic-type acetolactate synthase large subunit [Vicinamibacterales bacterium]